MDQNTTSPVDGGLSIAGAVRDGAALVMDRFDSWSSSFDSTVTFCCGLCAMDVSNAAI